MKSIIDIILEIKKVKFADFFNLDKKPDFPGVTLDELKQNHEKILSNLKHTKQYYINNNDAIYEEISKINHYILKNKKHITDMENTIDDYNYAYDSLVDLLTEIINKDNIDLTKYSINITESEWRKLTRGRRIDDLMK